MPIYEYECAGCGERFEELMSAAAAAPGCPSCGTGETRRVFTSVSPPGRLPRGPGVRSADSRRSEREAARTDRITESRKRRAAGEKP